MKKNDDALVGKLRRGIIRVGLEVVQGLNSKSVATPTEEDIPENVEEFRNNPYINREGIPLAMDIFKPKGPEYEGKDLPVIVAIHGGGLITGDRKISLNLSRELASKGYLVFAIEYRLAPRANVCEQFDDICAGMDFVGEKLLEFDVDYTRIFMTADSAGAFLAVYTAAMKTSKKLQDAIGYKPSRMVFKAIGLSCGMFYTNKDDILGALLSEQFYGDKKDDKGFLQYMNPECPEIINNLPPTFLVTSRGDFLNSYTIQFEAALKKAGKTTKMLYYSETDLAHTFNFAHPDLPQSKDANAKMLAFFEEQATLQAKRQRKNRETQNKLKEIESKIKDGSYNDQKLWKIISDLNSVSDEKLDIVALRDDARVLTYRQLLRKWNDYAEVFSGLKINEKSKSRVGIVGALTKEAVFSFYALNMTGADISLLPYSYSKKAEQLLEAVKEEKLTDLILTDFETKPAILKAILEQKEALKLNNVIILDSEIVKPGADEDEIQAKKENKKRLKKVNGAVFMSDLLVKYEAVPVVFGKNSGESSEIIIHKWNKTKDKYEAVVYTDKEINEAVLGNKKKIVAEDDDLRVALTSDLSNAYVLINELQPTLCSGCSIVITYKSGYRKDFLTAVTYHHINNIIMYPYELEEQIKGVAGKKLIAASLDNVQLLAEKVPKEKIEEYTEFFKKNGGNTKIDLLTVKGKGYSKAPEIQEKEKAPEKAAAPAVPAVFAAPKAMNAGTGLTRSVPGMPYGYGAGSPFGLPGMNAGGKKKNPLIWVDSNGNEHDLKRIFVKLFTALSMVSKANKGKKNQEPGAEPDGEESKRQLMSILAVLFNPSETDYYYED